MRLIRYRSWAEPVKFRWAVIIHVLWYFQRYTPIRGPYHRAWDRAVRANG